MPRLVYLYRMPHAAAGERAASPLRPLLPLRCKLLRYRRVPTTEMNGAMGRRSVTAMSSIPPWISWSLCTLSTRACYSRRRRERRAA